MVGGLGSLCVATLAFTGGHFLLSGALLRPPLTTRFGVPVFRLVYSALAAAALVWMIRAYDAAPYIRLWDVGLIGPPVILIFMLLASIFFVCSVTTRNPTLAGFDGLHHAVAPGRGIYAVTRHPMLSAIALWAAAHLFVRGDVAAIVFFGGFFILAAGGMAHIDSRRRAQADDAWRAFEAGTSRTPFRAIFEGRRALRPNEVGWWRIGAGVALYAAILYVHETVFGMDLFPV